MMPNPSAQVEIQIPNNNEQTNLLPIQHESINKIGGMSSCCYWSVVLGISGIIIGTTIWCLARYYTYTVIPP